MIQERNTPPPPPPSSLPPGPPVAPHEVELPSGSSVRYEDDLEEEEEDYIVVGGLCSNSSSSSSGGSGSPPPSSFTQTFLRGILGSIDNKDPVVANAWLETLLDAIDLLPPEVVKREVVPIAVSKAQISQPLFGREASCRLLGKIAGKLDVPSARTCVLPIVLSLSQDGDPEVRFVLCRNLALVARGVGLEATKDAILPQIVELSRDESPQVRVVALETLVNLIHFLDDSSRSQIIVPLIIKIFERAKAREENLLLPNIAHFYGRILHGLKNNLTAEQKHWCLEYYKSLSKSGISDSPLQSPSRVGSSSVAKGKMPDIVPASEDKTLMHSRVRRECALNFPAVVSFLGAEAFADSLFRTFAHFVADACPGVRCAVASSIHELVKLLGSRFVTLDKQICSLFADVNIHTLEAMVKNMVDVIDALAKFGALQFGAGLHTSSSPATSNLAGDLSSALLHCEDVISQTRNWRLHADCLEKFSCLANCISPTTILNKFVPTLFNRIHRSRTLPCKTAASRTLLVFLRFTVRSEDRKLIMYRVKEELGRGKSCSSRMLFLRLCEMAIALFSKDYFKQYFFSDMLTLYNDSVPNVRLKLCSLLPKLKALLFLPSDGELLLTLENSVKKLLLREKDRDVLYTLQTVIQELDRTETGVDGIPSVNIDEDRDNERKLREERLISSMEEQIIKIHNEMNPIETKIHQYQQQVRRRSESVPREFTVSPPREDKPSQFPGTLIGQLNRSHRNDLNLSQPCNLESNKASPYSQSLENLDPSAKEFLVDAGITLDIRKNESLPNLNQINLEREEEPFSKYLASNSETQLYNTNYQRSETPINMLIKEPFSDESKVVVVPPESPSAPRRTTRHVESKLRPPNWIKVGTSSSASTSTSSSIIDISSVSNLAHNTLSKLPYSKLVSSTDRIQGSIERLTEKWESKRRNLTTSNTSDSVASVENSKPKPLIVEPLKTSMIPSKRNSIFLAKKQKKRLSLTDHVGAASKQAVHKLIMPKRKNSPEEESGAEVKVDDRSESKGEPENRSKKEVIEEDMVTYVPPLTTSTSTISQKAKLVTATNLIVKPLSSTSTTTSTFSRRSLPVPSAKFSSTTNMNSHIDKRNGNHTVYHQTQQQQFNRTSHLPKQLSSHVSKSSSIPSFSATTAHTSSLTTVSTPSYVPKFSRVPPPKYRNPPSTSIRRPLSQQESSIRSYSQQKYEAKKNPQGKSLSAECILDRVDYARSNTNRFSSPPPSSYNTTPRPRKANGIRLWSNNNSQTLQRSNLRSSRSPSPSMKEQNPPMSNGIEATSSKLRIPTHSSSIRYASADQQRRPSSIHNESRQSSTSMMTKRKSAHYPATTTGGAVPKHQQQQWSKNIQTPRNSYSLNCDVGNGNLKSKPSQGLPAPGFSRLPVGSFGPR